MISSPAFVALKPHGKQPETEPLYIRTEGLMNHGGTMGTQLILCREDRMQHGGQVGQLNVGGLQVRACLFVRVDRFCLLPMASSPLGYAVLRTE